MLHWMKILYIKTIDFIHEEQKYKNYKVTLLNYIAYVCKSRLEQVLIIELSSMVNYDVC